MRRMLILAVVLCIVMSTTSLNATQKTLPITQVWQHKDTNMWCVPGGAGVIHQVHSPGCIHCDFYCAPAAVSMYALYMGRQAPFTQQDKIYDNGKSSQGEVTGNDTLETHGVGMYCGIGQFPPEVQQAFNYGVGVWPFQFGPLPSAPGVTSPADIYAFDIDIAKAYINANIPVLWIDVGTWPDDMELIGTQPDLEQYSGHCKIIAGYDDKNTPEDPYDDLLYIYDPWPTSGSPYWAAATSVIDFNDIYLTICGPETATEPTSWGKIKSMYK